jgi:hypothetical protein
MSGHPATRVRAVDDVAGNIEADEGLPWRPSEQGETWRMLTTYVSEIFFGESFSACPKGKFLGSLRWIGRE